MIRSLINTHGRRRSPLLDLPLIQRISSRPPFPLTSRVCHRAYAAAASVPVVPRYATQTTASSSPDQAAISGKLAAIHRLLAVDFGGSDAWLRRVDAAREDIASTRPTTIGVFGGEFAGQRDVLSALLRDPLADTESSRDALVKRHVDSATEVLSIEYGQDAKRTPDTLSLPSTWLQKSGMTVREISTSGTERVIDELLQTDVAVLVLDPLYLLSIPQIAAIASAVAQKPGLTLVVNGSLPPSQTEDDVRDRLRQQWANLAHSPNAPEPNIVFVHAHQAMSAFDTFSSGMQEASITARSDAVEAFQRQYDHSHIGSLQTCLSKVVEQMSDPQIATASATARLSLLHLQEIIHNDRRVSLAARDTIRALRAVASQAKLDAKHLSVINRGIDGGMVEGGVDHSIAQTRHGLEHLFCTRWSWLNLIMKARADEVGVESKAYVDQQFGKDLERSLVFEAGQLAQLQKSLSAETDTTLRHLADPHCTSHPISSPILLNHLSTLTLSIPPFEADSLLSPVQLRRQQLMQETLPRLQTSVQRSLISSLIIASGGVGLSWSAYISPLTALSAASATGCGLLSIVVALALGQRWWGRAQSRFWTEWQRVTSMLHGDLKANLAEVIEARLVIKPMAAASGLEDIIDRRERRLDDLEQAINDLSKQNQ